MKLLILLVFYVLFTVSTVFAGDSRTTIFEGFDMKIESNIDEMTDKKSGVIFLHLGPVYLAIYGHNDYAIFSNKDNLLFAHDGEHLIRSEGSKPFTLNTMSKQNGLRPANKVEAESVINSLLKGQEVKLRYFGWPKYDEENIKIKNPNIAFVYNKASELFGWKNSGLTSAPGSVELVVMPIPNNDLVSAFVGVQGNSDLRLTKKSDKKGGGAIFNVGSSMAFGFQNGGWINEEVGVRGRDHLIIRNSEGAIIFKELLPNSYINTSWPVGERAAIAAWKSAPLGSIEVEGKFRKQVILFGFRELWKWGIDNAGFPTLEGK